MLNINNTSETKNMLHGQLLKDMIDILLGENSNISETNYAKCSKINVIGPWKAWPNLFKITQKAFGPSSQKSTMFNSYFHSVFSDINDDMSQPDLTEQLITSLSTIKFTEYDVIKVLKQLDINKGTPPNNIPLLILHNYAKELAPSPLVLFNRSLSVGKIPSVWKHAYIVPIHKKDSKEMVENYRPISLLNNASKVMERLVFNDVYSVIEPCISHAQHGFIHKRSTTSNLLDKYGEVCATLDQGGQTDVIFLDFSKAFDSVPHNLLIHKLRSFGFNGNLLN